VFPALDPAEAVRYVQTRYLHPAAGLKYDNPAAARGNNPRLAWTSCIGERRPGVLVVCEGIPDALTAAQAGFAAVGLLGAHAPDRAVAARLATTARRDGLAIVTVVDADPAGRRLANTLGQLLASHGLDLTVIEPPQDGLDLNAWARIDRDWPSVVEHALLDRHCVEPTVDIDAAGIEPVSLAHDIPL
jgi:hypothetical protein